MGFRRTMTVACDRRTKWRTNANIRGLAHARTCNVELETTYAAPDIIIGECMAFLASGSKPNYSDTAIFESIIMMPFPFVFILHNYYTMQMMVIIEKYYKGLLAM